MSCVNRMEISPFDEVVDGEVSALVGMTDAEVSAFDETVDVETSALT